MQRTHLLMEHAQFRGQTRQYPLHGCGARRRPKTSLPQHKTASKEKVDDTSAVLCTCVAPLSAATCRGCWVVAFEGHGTYCRWTPLHFFSAFPWVRCAPKTRDPSALHEPPAAAVASSEHEPFWLLHASAWAWSLPEMGILKAEMGSSKQEAFTCFGPTWAWRQTSR